MLSRQQLWSSLMIGLLILAGSPSTAQESTSSQVLITPEASMVLTRQEQQTFEERFRAASSEKQRQQIAAELQNLVRERRADGGTTILIPPKSDEQAEDLIMPGVPTPRLERGISGDTLPGGALSGTGSGTSPAINPLGGPGGIGPGQR